MLAFGLGYPCARTSPGITFNITSTGNAQADAGFQAAAGRWSSLYTDNITVNINAGFTLLGLTVLGQTSSSTIAEPYSDVRAALVGDAKTASDAIAVANLPAAPSLIMITNTRSGARFVDSDGSRNNTVLDISTANAKALGLIGANDPAVDASITFNSILSFDFDPSDGITVGRYDFVGVPTHEIGHALGFISGVDVVDYYSGPNGPNKNTNINLDANDPGIGTIDPYEVFSVLDLYRYSASSIGEGAGVLDLAYGDSPFFSVDGVNSLGAFSTGTFNGNGRQASHWQYLSGQGIMDPTIIPGQLMTISALDTTALDVIGFDLVPEPQSYILVTVGGLILLFRTRDSRGIGLRCCAWIARCLPKLLALCRPPRTAWRT